MIHFGFPDGYATICNTHIPHDEATIDQPRVNCPRCLDILGNHGSEPAVLHEIASESFGRRRRMRWEWSEQLAQWALSTGEDGQVVGS